MIDTSSVLHRLLGAVLLTLIAAGPSLLASPAQAAGNDCALNTMASAMGVQAAELPAAERRQLIGWCKQEKRKEQRAVPRGPQALSSGDDSGGAGATDLAGADTETAIWCGKNNCVCWKGKKYDGCHHTDKLCSTPLKCVGRICGCTATE